MPQFQFGNTTIDYTLDYQQNIKDVMISVEWLDGVAVKAPKGIETEKLNEVLHKKAPWILDKWQEFNEITEPPAPKEFISGEKFPYLGRHYRLKVYKKEIGEATLAFQNGRFIAEIPKEMDEERRKQQLRDLFKKWYLEKGLQKIITRIDLYTPKIMETPSRVALKEQKMRWGTCTKNGAILLNWKIAMAPISVIDYVIVHEMAHLKYPDHSDAFWRLVRSVLPNYKHRKEWLRVNGPRLSLD